MMRIMWVFLAVACCAAMLSAQDSSGMQMKPHEMTGTICNSSCVTTSANLATCDTNCTDKSGDVVLVDDQGNVKKIANQDMAKQHMGKHVKMMVAPSEKEREELLRIMDITEAAP